MEKEESYHYFDRFLGIKKITELESKVKLGLLRRIGNNINISLISIILAYTLAGSIVLGGSYALYGCSCAEKTKEVIIQCNSSSDCPADYTCVDKKCVVKETCTTGTRSCYTGPTGTRNIGACKEGVQTCTNGTWSSCTETTPTTEICSDGIDNDCDCLVDSDCTPCAYPPCEVWNWGYNGGSYEIAYGIVVDSSCNAYVTGVSSGNYKTIKYGSGGWDSTYSSGTGRGITVDSYGYVYIAGSNYRIIKYDFNGNIVWNKTYNNVDSYGIAVDGSGNIYVIGDTDNGTTYRWDFIIIKLNSDGNIILNKTYDGGNSHDDRGRGIALDSSGNIYVTGWSITYNGADTIMRTIKYDKNGNIIWNKTYDAGVYDYGRSIAVDGLGNVYITGRSYDGINAYFRTIKYDKNGNIIWNKTYNCGNTDYNYGGNGIAVDGSGNVYVTGINYDGTYPDFRTIKYDNNGNIIWDRAYNSGKYDAAYGIAVDGSGNVYVTGVYSDTGGLEGTWDFRTIKYRQH